VLRLHHPQQALEPRILFGAFADGRMVGYIAGHFSTRHGVEGELQSLYVRASHQRQQIGTELLKRLASWFAAHGRRTICVGVEPANPYWRFYEKHGARYINKHWLVWDDIGAVADESYRDARS
jgi:GNAT superfamily N-acetyltransferase